MKLIELVTRHRSRAIIVGALILSIWSGRIFADTITFPDFSDLTGLNLNGSAAQAEGALLRLTPELGTGSAYLNCPIAFSPNTSFHTRFRFRIHGEQGTFGADGLVFVVQNDSAGPHVVGIAGFGIAYMFTSPSVAVELDTFQNEDPSDNHVALLSNGDVSTHLAFATPEIDLNDGASHNLWVDYDGPSKLLEVFLADSDVKPAKPALLLHHRYPRRGGLKRLLRLQCLDRRPPEHPRRRGLAARGHQQPGTR